MKEFHPLAYAPRFITFHFSSLSLSFDCIFHWTGEKAFMLNYGLKIALPCGTCTTDRPYVCLSSLIMHALHRTLNLSLADFRMQFLKRIFQIEKREHIEFFFEMDETNGSRVGTGFITSIDCFGSTILLIFFFYFVIHHLPFSAFQRRFTKFVSFFFFIFFNSLKTRFFFGFDSENSIRKIHSILMNYFRLFIRIWFFLFHSFSMNFRIIIQMKIVWWKLRTKQ